MTLDEAIKHAKETAENLEYEATNKPHLFDSQGEIDEYVKCAEEHRQLAEWLDDLKKIKTYPFGIRDNEVEKLEYLTSTKIGNHDDFLDAISILLLCL